MEKVGPRNIGPHKINTGVVVDLNNKTTQQFVGEIARVGGPLPYSKFMAISLFGEDGFYNSGKVEIGENKDFTTHPELTPYFNHTLARGLSEIWQIMGRPEKFRVIEMGAGEGTMAKGILEYAKAATPDFYTALDYIILEYSQGLIPRQRAKVNDPDHLKHIRGSAFDLPIANFQGVFISNELPDAFPIERVKRINGQLKQCFVTVEDSQWVEVWDELNGDVKDYVEKYQLSISEGQEEPVNLMAVRFQAQMDRALTKGAIITIDYGRNGEVSTGLMSLGRAIEKGETQNLSPYLHPGDVDITTSVNFKVLEQIAKSDGLEVAFRGKEIALLAKWGLLDLVRQESEMPLTHWPDILTRAQRINSLKENINHFFYSQVLIKGIKGEDVFDQEAILRLPQKLQAIINNPPSFDNIEEEMDYDDDIVFGLYRLVKIPPVRIKLGKPNAVFLTSDPRIKEEDRVLSLGGYSYVLTNEEGIAEVDPLKLPSLEFYYFDKNNPAYKLLKSGHGIEKIEDYGFYEFKQDYNDVVSSQQPDFDLTDRKQLEMVLTRSGYTV